MHSNCEIFLIIHINTNLSGETLPFISYTPELASNLRQMRQWVTNESRETGWSAQPYTLSKQHNDFHSENLPIFISVNCEYTPILVHFEVCGLRPQLPWSCPVPWPEAMAAEPELTARDNLQSVKHILVIWESGLTWVFFNIGQH